jgi:hypothetical protein
MVNCGGFVVVGGMNVVVNCTPFERLEFVTFSNFIFRGDGRTRARKHVFL